MPSQPAAHVDPALPDLHPAKGCLYPYGPRSFLIDTPHQEEPQAPGSLTKLRGPAAGLGLALGLARFPRARWPCQFCWDLASLLRINSWGPGPSDLPTSPDSDVVP